MVVTHFPDEPDQGGVGLSGAWGLSGWQSGGVDCFGRAPRVVGFVLVDAFPDEGV